MNEDRERDMTRADRDRDKDRPAGAGDVGAGGDAAGVPSRPLGLADRPTVDAGASASARPADAFATIAPEYAVPVVEPATSGLIRLSTLDEPAQGDARTRYSRTQLHAKGGIGQVWLARDGDLGREVALKELRPERGTSPEAWARFVAEARITGQLEHPGIVPVYELAVHPEDGDPFYTMRFIRGKTLFQAIRDHHEKRAAGRAGPLDRAALLTDFVSLCNTVGYAHSRGVIHRDLKGQNVVLGDFGEVMLLDWGIAKLVGEGDPGRGPATSGALPPLAAADDGAGRDATGRGQVIGTPAYMAPEQAEGRNDAIDARTDVYSLGAILYEILAGRPPFEGSSTVELLRKVAAGTPTPPHQVAPGAPRALEAACLKAMARRPADRYPTPLALADDVRRWLADEPVAAFRDPWTTRLARLAKRHRTAVAAAGALLATAVVALAIAAVVVGRERDEARLQRRQARQAVDDNYTRVAEEWLADRLDPLQREFLTKALAYYRDFAGPDAGDIGLRQERGRAYLRMGDVLRKLGPRAEAEPAYRQAVAILGRVAADDPADARHRDGQAEATYRLGAERAARRGAGELDEAARLFRQAIALQEAVLAEAATPSRRVALGRTLDALADLLRVTGRPDDAEAAFRRAIPLLERAAADQPGEVPPRQELGAALDGLGILLKARGRADEARAAVARAVGVFEPLVADAPTLPAPRDALARAYNTLGLLLREAGMEAEARVVLDKEAALNRRLAEDYPGRPGYRRDLARALTNLGVIEREANRLAEAEPRFAEALKLLERLQIDDPGDRKDARDLAGCLVNFADLRLGRKGESEPLYRRSLKISDELIAAAPGVAEYQLGAARALQGLGGWLASNRRGDEAIEALKQAVARYDGLATADGANPATRRGLARSLQALGVSYRVAGRPAEAEEAFGRAVNAHDQLVSLPAARPADRLALADCLSSRGINQTNAGLPGGEDSLRRSLVLLEALAKEGPPPENLRLQIAATRNNLGDWLAKNDHAQEAEASYRAGVDLFAQLVRDFPTRALYKGYLGQARGGLGEFLIAQDRPTDALPLLEQGVGEQRADLAAGPQAREAFRRNLGMLAKLHLERRAYVEAARVADEMSKVAGDAPTGRAEVARLMAQCAALAQADDKLPPARRDVLAGDYADRAIAQLREAVGRGGPEGVRLLQDPAFNPIRDRSGFKALELDQVDRRAALAPPRPELPPVAMPVVSGPPRGRDGSGRATLPPPPPAGQHRERGAPQPEQGQARRLGDEHRPRRGPGPDVERPVGDQVRLGHVRDRVEERRIRRRRIHHARLDDQVPDRQVVHRVGVGERAGRPGQDQLDVGEAGGTPLRGSNREELAVVDAAAGEHIPRDAVIAGDVEQGDEVVLEDLIARDEQQLEVVLGERVFHRGQDRRHEDLDAEPRPGLAQPGPQVQGQQQAGHADVTNRMRREHEGFPDEWSPPGFRACPPRKPWA